MGLAVLPRGHADRGRALPALVLCACAVLWGCGDSDKTASPPAPPPEPRRICDGSDTFRFLWQVPIVLSAVAEGAGVLSVNGHEFVFLRGDCQYWVQIDNNTDYAGEVHTGTLSAAEEKELHDAVHYDEWPQLAGIYEAQRASSVADVGPPHAFSDLTNHVYCYASCFFDEEPEEKTPEPVEAMFAAIRDWVPRLYDAGTPLEGPVRILGNDITDAAPGWGEPGSLYPYPRYQTQPWTLDTPLASYVGDLEVMRPDDVRGFRVELPDADTLRQWRTNRRDGLYAPEEFGFIPVKEDDGPLIALYLRDVLPFENKDDGLVPFGPFAQEEDE